jgi:hypothetical protein
MMNALRERGWRSGIALAVAYALVLQVFFAYSVASQIAAQDVLFGTDSFAVLCTSHNPAATDDTGSPVRPAVHCPACTLAGITALTLPDPVALSIRDAATTQRPSPAAVGIAFSSHRARAGLSRAPPQNA